MDALDKMAEHIGDPMTAVDVGPRFNCGELDSIVVVLALSGNTGAALTLLEGHALGEDEEEGDLHWVPAGTFDAVAYLAGLVPGKKEKEA